ncbi:MAG: hypothetical protein [Wendovervirus sonii]|uniref:N-acetyltransferase domain-containing protein n=1 Tax=phage Lak_Megaphage_Sonny TaxID=3109229 RepID=A0ABZ0Z5Q1_9CAUD|nr:MAG: hypothetical protein [phage Lak_Megaphage_Sonny]
MNKKQLYESIMHSVAKQVLKALNENEMAEKDGQIKIDKSKIKVVEIKNIDQLINIVHNSEPDEKTNIGFWLFYNDLKKDYRMYGSINKAPIYIRYFAYLYDGDVIALKGFSTEYYTKYQYNEKFAGYVRYMGFQVDSAYKGNDLQNYLNKQFEEQFKKLGYKGITMMCYTPSLCQKYLRDGYKGKENFMWKTF